MTNETSTQTRQVHQVPAVLIAAALIAASCGSNPQGFQPWPDGAEYYIGSPAPHSDTALAFNPGGNVLLFCSDYSGNPGIYGYSYGSDPSLRTFSNLDESNGPNGCWSDAVGGEVGKIIYSAIRNDNSTEIRWIQGNLADVHLFLYDSLEHRHPSWNPGADSVIMSTFDNGAWGLWITAFDEVSPTPLFTPGGVDCLMPSYSPDGDWIIFERRESGQSDIWVVRPDGSDAHEVVGGSSNDMHPCWGHGGGWFTFSSDRTGNFEIWVGNTGTGDLFKVTDDPADDIYPAWNPVSDWIAFSSDRRHPGASYDIFWITPTLPDRF
ncbi:MAG TPA: hypothetical protein PLF04_04485 [Candidatus Fermentibacter daniensis]|nr:hypothetical protein [Candidatus Fermentibacter daniensis]